MYVHISEGVFGWSSRDSLFINQVLRIQYVLPCLNNNTTLRRLDVHTISCMPFIVLVVVLQT